MIVEGVKNAASQRNDGESNMIKRMLSPSVKDGEQSRANVDGV